MPPLIRRKIIPVSGENILKSMAYSIMPIRFSNPSYAAPSNLYVNWINNDPIQYEGGADKHITFTIYITPYDDDLKPFSNLATATGLIIDMSGVTYLQEGTFSFEYLNLVCSPNIYLYVGTIIRYPNDFLPNWEAALGVSCLYLESDDPI